MNSTHEDAAARAWHDLALNLYAATRLALFLPVRVFAGEAMRSKLAALEKRLAARPVSQRMRTSSVRARESKTVLVNGR